MPTISVVIPACNEEKYIEATLNSLKQQEFNDYETIVVCNGCTDNTESIAKQHEGENTTVISFPEANVSKARNIGASKASGSVLLFLDADSTLEQDALSKINEQFMDNHYAATTKAKPGTPSLKFNLALGLKNFYLSTGLYEGCSGALICRRGDFDKVNGYDSALIVKEHRKLIIKLKRATQKEFVCINTHLTTSMRRYQQWGLSKSAVFWTKQWLKNYLGDLKKSEYEKIR
ncbi:glycosyltransferase [Candidatus Woesearchaeota archaeon]|nr:glycosyltransferase [Candidatus Woesearchaeota archaeon]